APRGGLVAALRSAHAPIRDSGGSVLPRQDSGHGPPALSLDFGVPRLVGEGRSLASFRRLRARRARDGAAIAARAERECAWKSTSVSTFPSGVSPKSRLSRWGLLELRGAVGSGQVEDEDLGWRLADQHDVGRLAEGGPISGAERHASDIDF